MNKVLSINTGEVDDSNPIFDCPDCRDNKECVGLEDNYAFMTGVYWCECGTVWVIDRLRKPDGTLDQEYPDSLNYHKVYSFRDGWTGQKEAISWIAEGK